MKSIKLGSTWFFNWHFPFFHRMKFEAQIGSKMSKTEYNKLAANVMRKSKKSNV